MVFIADVTIVRIMEKTYVRLNDIRAYKRALELSNAIWNIAREWDIFAKKTIGDQFVRSADSISANIAEGFGRYFKKEKIRFYRYANGSTYESYDWCYKAYKRHLLSDEQYTNLITELRTIEKELNGLIKSANIHLRK